MNKLFQEVHEALPVEEKLADLQLGSTQSTSDAKIEYHIREVLKLLQITNEEVLENTPRRFREVLQDRTESTRKPLDRKVLKTFPLNNPGIVIVRDIEVNSMCEHHLMPFFGTVSIAYLPKKNVLGLSKLARIVNYCSKKESLQERLTEEIAETINDAVENDGVCILVKCKHFCMILNDEIKSKSDTVTIYKTGQFKRDPKVFEEFLNALKI